MVSTPSWLFRNIQNKDVKNGHCNMEAQISRECEILYFLASPYTDVEIAMNRPLVICIHWSFPNQDTLLIILGSICLQGVKVTLVIRLPCYSSTPTHIFSFFMGVFTRQVVLP